MAVLYRRPYAGSVSLRAFGATLPVEQLRKVRPPNMAISDRQSNSTHA
jgi:hypothetical protein